MRKKRAIAFILTAVLAALMGALPLLGAQAEIPYDGYIYDESTEQKAIKAPNGYLPERLIQASNYGLGRFAEPQDLFVSESSEIYIVDSGNGRVVVLNDMFELIKIVDSFKTATGEDSPLSSPRGIFVSADGRMIIADYGNERVLVTDLNGNIQRIIKKPQTDLLDKKWVFNPIKVVEDTNGLIYVQADRLIEGAMMFHTDGSFLGFFGSNMAQTNVIEAFWKKVLSSVQLSYMTQSVPVENSNLFIDKKNFIYAVNAKSQSDDALVKKFNPSGKNVLKTDEIFGDFTPAADKRFVDIAVDDDEIIYILDQETGKVFVHNMDGKLLAVFGGDGEQMGTFDTASSLALLHDKVLVLDQVDGTMTVFAPTPFMQDVKQALRLFNNGLFLESMEPWQKVLRQDVNYSMANYGLAKALFLQNDYEGAMKYYKRTYDSRQEYSDAFKEYRRELIKAYLFPALAALVALAVVVLATKKLLKGKGRTGEKKKNRVRPFALRVMRHPFETLNELKYEHGGTLRSAVVTLAVFLAACVLLKGEQGYIHNADYGKLINIPMTVLSCLAVFLLFTVANWSICTLTDGKGKYIEIFRVCAYALLPFSMAAFLSVGLTYALTIEESAFISVLLAAGVIWSVILLLIGLQTIHMYTMGKVLTSCLLTLLGVAIIVFIGTLFYSLLYQVYMFFYTIFYELRIR